MSTSWREAIAEWLTEQLRRTRRLPVALAIERYLETEISNLSWTTGPAHPMERAAYLGTMAHALGFIEDPLDEYLALPPEHPLARRRRPLPAC
jgi:hypothetical protein